MTIRFGTRGRPIASSWTRAIRQSPLPLIQYAYSAYTALSALATDPVNLSPQISSPAPQSTLIPLAIGPYLRSKLHPISRRWRPARWILMTHASTRQSCSPTRNWIITLTLAPPPTFGRGSRILSITARFSRTIRGVGGTVQAPGMGTVHLPAGN